MLIIIAINIWKRRVKLIAWLQLTVFINKCYISVIKK